MADVIGHFFKVQVYNHSEWQKNRMSRTSGSYGHHKYIVIDEWWGEPECTDGLTGRFSEPICTDPEVRLKPPHCTHQQAA